MPHGTSRVSVQSGPQSVNRFLGGTPVPDHDLRADKNTDQAAKVAVKKPIIHEGGNDRNTFSGTSTPVNTMSQGLAAMDSLQTVAVAADVISLAAGPTPIGLIAGAVGFGAGLGRASINDTISNSIADKEGTARSDLSRASDAFDVSNRSGLKGVTISAGKRSFNDSGTTSDTMISKNAARNSAQQAPNQNHSEMNSLKSATSKSIHTDREGVGFSGNMSGGSGGGNASGSGAGVGHGGNASPTGSDMDGA